MSTLQNPTSIGIIMDGNRRWARARGTSSVEGHRAGYEKFTEVVSWIGECDIPYAIFYTFSSENWKRSTEEVSYLFDLFTQAALEQLSVAHKEQVRVRVIGNRDALPSGVQDAIGKLENDTASYTRGTIVLALSYGGREEIVRAANTLLQRGVSEVDEEVFAQTLWTADIPDPDIIIRTGGEKRLSNFLPWQSTYSELAFTDTFWPDLEKEEFMAIIEECRQRQRRKGA